MNQLTFLSLLALVGAVSGFSSIQATRVQFGLNGKASSKLFLAKTAGDQGDQGDFPPEEESEEFTGSVDWDAEWKKVVATDGKLSSGERPGRDFYKSEAEISAIKAANKASEKAVDVGVNMSNAMPDMRSLAGDWKVSNKNPRMTICERKQWNASHGSTMNN
jgi:hypothetical protein